MPEGLLLCEPCQELLVGTSSIRCLRCGSIVSALAGQNCLNCHKQRLRFDRVVTLGAYSGELRRSILQLKSAGHESLALALGTLLATRERASLQDAQAEAVLPIPMHWSRRLVRRTNSAEQLAAVIAAQLDVPLWHRPLRRVRATRKQGPMLRTERIRNVRGAFRVSRDFDVRGKRLVLVDDILTTGATCHEAAKVLKRAGAAAVTVAVLARADTLR